MILATAKLDEESVGVEIECVLLGETNVFVSDTYTFRVFVTCLCIALDRRTV